MASLPSCSIGSMCVRVSVGSESVEFDSLVSLPRLEKCEQIGQFLSTELLVQARRHHRDVSRAHLLDVDRGENAPRSR